MKTLSAKAKIRGFTLVEVIVVLAVLVILVAMLLPAISRPHRGRLAGCMKNQMQIVLGLIMWNGDNNGKFPWQVSSTNNGTMEFIGGGHPSSQFRALSGYVKPFGIYICPSDTNRHPATNYETFSDQNTSYFVNVDAATNTASTILTGDRHLVANGWPVKSGLFTFTNNTIMGWTRELHGKRGNGQYPIGFMGFADGHAQIGRGKDLTSLFQQQGPVSIRLAIP